MQLIRGSLAHLSQSKHSSRSYLGFSRACGSSRARPAGFFSASSWVNNSSSASTLPCFKQCNNINVSIFNSLLLTQTTLNTIDWKKRKNLGIIVHTNTLKFFHQLLRSLTLKTLKLKLRFSFTVPIQFNRSSGENWLKYQFDSSSLIMYSILMTTVFQSTDIMRRNFRLISLRVSRVKERWGHKTERN